MGLLLSASLGMALLTSTNASSAQAETNLLDVTCGQYLTALSVAQPPKNASSRQKQLAQDAQDDIVNGLMWIHGYLAGKTAARGGAVPALTKGWMSEQVAILATACQHHSPDGTKLLTEVVAEL